MALPRPAGAVEARVTQYVALGDSVAAGIGAGSPSADSRTCYVNGGESGPKVPNSSLAYPKRVARALGARLIDRASCGSDVATVRSQQVPAVTKRTDLVTVQTGANDFGFSRHLTYCFLWNPPSTGECNARINRIADNFRTRLPERLEKLYDRIDIRKAKSTKVVVVGYPHLVLSRSTILCFNDGAWPTSTHQALRRAANALNAVLAAKAREHGYVFVDPRASFNGHESCGDPEWVNGVRPLWSRVESFHPNATGQQALGWLVWQYVRP
ncbi:SGNH/GDSL hydrolase family protein [Streptomyces sp. NPDC002520]